MKKLFNILLPFALLSFSSVIHAEDDASGIVVSQTISNTPDANGQYSVTMEAYVKGKSTTSTTEPSFNTVETGKKPYVILGFSNNTELYNWWNSFENKIEVNLNTGSMGGGEKWKLALTDLLYGSNHYPIYIGYNGNYLFVYKQNTNYYFASNTITFSSTSSVYFSSTIYRQIPGETIVDWQPSYGLLDNSSTISATFDGFVIPSGATITKQTADCTSYSEESGTATFGSATTTSTVSATRSDDGSTITISGFDFSGNFCGGPDGDSNYMGKKLIVTFPVATTVSNTGGSAKTVVNTVTVTNKSSQPVTGLTPSTATLDLPNLTIQVSGVNANDNCIFTVSGTAGSSWNKTFTVMTHGATPVKLQALPAGTYTITPTSWPWTYNLPDPKNIVTLSGAGRTETFTFTPKTITTPHHGEASANTPAN